jgi:formylglycine-generating enzyme required for sulfatase activity
VKTTFYLILFLISLVGISFDSEAKHLKSIYSKPCESCPQMVVVPKGNYLIGSAEFNEDEQPQKQIFIGEFSVSRFEITVAEYRLFSEQVGYKEKVPCLVMGESGSWYHNEEASWDRPGFEQEDDHPVVCISWQGAKAYIDWLNSKLDSSATQFRLLTESEWEYAARAGSKTSYWWGQNENDFCVYTNGADALSFDQYPQWALTGECNDGHLYTAPVGFYHKPNAFNLEDMVGNVWEWVEDCYVDNYQALPANGQAQMTNPCEKRVFRGGAWGDYGSFYLRSSYRGAWAGAGAFSNLGFRVARNVAPE